MAIIRLISGFAILTVAGALAAEPVAELLTVQGTTIYPTNVAATVSDVASVTATTIAAAAKAEAVESAATLVSEAVAGVTELANSLEGIGYIRGHVLQFGTGIEANTNVTASIICLAPAGVDGENSLWDAYTYFTTDPGVLPYVRYTESLGRTGTWDVATLIGTPTIDNVLVGDTLYEAYRTRVAMPLSYTSAFLRVYADVTGGGTNQNYLRIENGIAVNGVTPLTGTFVDGTNVYTFVGGARVK